MEKRFVVFTPIIWDSLLYGKADGVGCAEFLTGVKLLDTRSVFIIVFFYAGTDGAHFYGLLLTLLYGSIGGSLLFLAFLNLSFSGPQSHSCQDLISCHYYSSSIPRIHGFCSGWLGFSLSIPSPH